MNSELLMEWLLELLHIYLQYSVLSVILEKLIITMMAVQEPIQTVWYKPSTWGFDWRKYVPFWKEDPPTLTSLTGNW